MLNNNLRTAFRFIFVLSICFLLLGDWVKPVSANTCNWVGGTSDHWNNTGNWSCGQVPTASDDVVIPAGTTYSPTAYPDEGGVFASTLQINEGAQMTLANGNMKVNTLTNNGILNIDTSTYSALINNDVSDFTINNNGTFSMTGANDVEIGIYGNGEFNNAGTVSIQNSTDRFLRLYNTAGTHSGTYQGNNLSIVGNKTNTFTETSTVNLKKWYVYTGVVNFGGTIISLNELHAAWSSSSSSGGTVNLLATANVTQIAQKVYIDYLSEIVLNDTSGNYSIPEFYFYYGELQNKGTLSITNKMTWESGNLTGSGTTTVSPGVIFSFMGGNKTLDSQTLINQATANWNYGNVTLLNSAVFQNDGTFNANATTTMTGGETERFINNEYAFFYKKTEDTTTTMNVPFTNSGTVEVVAGELVFSGAIVDLGDGTLDPGETLNLGEGSSLIGSGTLNANLINAGTVSPGSSPGLITVNGHYTQESTGALEIELGSPSSDKLLVTGEANLTGTLNVTFLPGFTPQPGNSFTILSYGSHTGSFTTANLPGGYEWDLNYGENDLVLSLASGGSISGTITCSGSLETNTNTVYVDLLKDSYGGTPDDTKDISCGESYIFSNLENGTYYVEAWLDLNESGGGSAEPGEPAALYDTDDDGEPNEIVITDGAEVTGKDIDLTGPEVTLSSATYTVGEADVKVTITAELSMPFALPVTVDYATSAGTATSGTDYNAASGTLTFPALETSQSFDVTIVGDILYEGDEIFNVTLSNPSSATLGSIDTAVVTITDDDDPPVVSLSRADYGALESGPNVTIVVTISGDRQHNVTIDYETSDGTATAGEDYAATSGTLTLLPTDLTQAFTVDILEDILYEGIEHFYVTISNPVGATLGEPSSAVVSITDNDPEPVEDFNLFLPLILR